MSGPAPTGDPIDRLVALASHAGAWLSIAALVGCGLVWCGLVWCAA